MRARTLALLAAMTGVARAEPPADPCDEPIDAPVAVAWRDAALDAGRAACLHPDVGLVVRGRALIDTPAFYGTLGGDVALAVRFVEGTRWEWGVTARAVDVAFIQNAVWQIVEPTYGPLTVHGARGGHLTLAGRPARWAAQASAQLPYTTSIVDSSRGGVQLAGLLTWAPSPRLRVHGRLAALGWYGRAVTGTSTRGAALLAVDGSVRARRWLSLQVGLDLQAGWYRDGVDHLAARLGAHWRVKGPWRVAVGVGAPVAGRERQDLAAALGVWRDLD